MLRRRLPFGTAAAIQKVMLMLPSPAHAANSKELLLKQVVGLLKDNGQWL